MRHLEGIKVLSEETATEVTGVGLLYILLAFVIAVAIAMLITNWDANKSEFVFSSIGLAILFIAWILSMIIKPLNNVTYKKYKEYEVLIEKTIDYKEFESTYEVVNHRGEIYKVKFKENKEEQIWKNVI